MKKILNSTVVIVVVVFGSVFVIDKIDLYGDTEDNDFIKSSTYEQVNYSNNRVEELREVEGYMDEGVQVIKFDLESNAFPTINLKKGVPTKLIINADDSLNNCNYEIVSDDLNFKKELELGENIIEFTPDEEGLYVYTCWMGMLGAHINVVDKDIVPNGFYGENIALDSCCTNFR
ncbi:MAG: cupredoxin domain-containing protein [Lachnospirales bacterium]